MTYEDKQRVDNKDTDDMVEPTPSPESRLLSDEEVDAVFAQWANETR